MKKPTTDEMLNKASLDPNSAFQKIGKFAKGTPEDTLLPDGSKIQTVEIWKQVQTHFRPAVHSKHRIILSLIRCSQTGEPLEETYDHLAEGVVMEVGEPWSDKNGTGSGWHVKFLVTTQVPPNCTLVLKYTYPPR